MYATLMVVDIMTRCTCIECICLNVSYKSMNLM